MSGREIRRLRKEIEFLDERAIARRREGEPDAQESARRELEEREAALEEIRAEMEARIAAERAALEASVEGEREERRKALDRARADREALLTAERKRAKQALAEQRERYETAARSHRERLEGQLETLKRNYEDLLAVERSRLDAATREVRTLRADLRASSQESSGHLLLRREAEVKLGEAERARVAAEERTEELMGLLRRLATEDVERSEADDDVAKVHDLNVLRGLQLPFD